MQEMEAQLFTREAQFFKFRGQLNQKQNRRVLCQSLIRGLCFATWLTDLGAGQQP